MALLSKTCQVFPAVWLTKSLLESAIKEAGLQVFTCRWKESKNTTRAKKCSFYSLKNNSYLSVPKSKFVAVFCQPLKSLEKSIQTLLRIIFVNAKKGKLMDQNSINVFVVVLALKFILSMDLRWFWSFFHLLQVFHVFHVVPCFAGGEVGGAGQSDRWMLLIKRGPKY